MECAMYGDFLGEYVHYSYYTVGHLSLSIKLTNKDTALFTVSVFWYKILHDFQGDPRSTQIDNA